MHNILQLILSGSMMVTCVLFMIYGCKSPTNDARSLNVQDHFVTEVSEDDLLDLSIADLHKKLIRGELRVEKLTHFYLSRIERFQRDQQKNLHAVISVNKDAIEVARKWDALSNTQKATTDLIWGIPILIKDNIETQDHLPTTAGSTALKDYFSGRDAPLVKNLRDKGAIILGKANLSEWSGLRAQPGWSAMGGQTLNPHNPKFDPSGSSSGSAVAVASGLAVAAIGTETWGSIVSPSGANQVIGIRPAQGIVSQDGIVPIMHQLDSAGPIARRVEDAAIVLDAMVQKNKNSSLFRLMVQKDGLRGKTLGYVAALENSSAKELWNAARQKLELAGARLVPFRMDKGSRSSSCDVMGVLTLGLKEDLERYLNGLPRQI
jgi:Asp-tRNA(Asn)/Glu-tRNA(Gln) amidotransferase A subunit family amidase